MIALDKAESGNDYLVTWMMGAASNLLRNGFGLKENTVIHVARSYRDGSAIISYDGKRVAIGSDTAYSVKLEPLSA